MYDYKTKTCNFCSSVLINKIGALDDSRYNIYCNCGKMPRMVDLSVPPKAYVEKPEWCPKMVNSDGTKKLDFSDKIDILRKMPAMTEWDDIKENEIYHLPQLPGEERKDIFVVKKDNSSLTYREVDGSQNIQYTIFPHTIVSKFLVKNKVKKFIVKNNTK